MPIRKRLEILSLGDELLLGLRENAHMAYLGRELARKGLVIARDQEIRDNAEDIRRYFLEAWRRADIVITVGGLGPTADDLTRQAVTEALGLKLVESAQVLDSLRAKVALMGRPLNERIRQQALIPEGAEVLPNHHGTAPGLWLERDGKILIMLPGPGSELRPIFMEEVLPRLEERDIALINDAFLQLRTCGIPESELQIMVAPVIAELAEQVSVGFRSHCGIVDIRLCADAEDVGWAVLERGGERIRALVGPDFVAYGEVSLAEVVIKMLRKAEKTVAVAESCTGGLLCCAFSDVPGASKVFRGGVVCYINEVKQELLGVDESILMQHGAVSCETAVALAAGAQERLDSDYALSVTGFAGPDGGEPGAAPVGTVFIGFASAEGVWSRKLFIAGSRQSVRERATVTALDWLRRKLMGEDGTGAAPSRG